MDGSIYSFGSSLLVGLGVGALFYKDRHQIDLEREEREKLSKVKRSPLLDMLRPLIISLASLIGNLPLKKKREKLRIRLLQAGSPGGLSPDEFIATKFIAALGGAALGFFVDDTVDLLPIMTLSLMALGFIYPDIYVSGMIQKRRRRVFRDMPDFLDTLRLTIDAGLDLSSALTVCVERGRKGPLLDELEKVERDVRLGRTRKEAFRAFADRLQMTEINAFVLALIQADQLGASIGPILRVQADVSRTRRWQAAEVIVNKMPMKMLAPLIALIFPASFIVLFTPLVIQYMQSK
jgi:tight adherence protein C